MRVLVVGGAGYIGCHVSKALKNAGFDPVIFDSMEQGHPWASRWGPIIQDTVLNTASLKTVLNQYKPLGVIHLAAYHNVRESALNPQKYYLNNCQGTLSLLTAMEACDITPLVFSSSAAVYGAPHYTPLDEEHPKTPLSPYGKTKWFIEQILADYSHIDSISLRYFNAAGADFQGECGEAHEPETHLIPLAISAALGKTPPLTIFGDDHATVDGTPVRDYIHVTDLAEAHVLALKYLLQNKGRLALNLGSGQGYSVKEVIQTAEKVLEKRVPYKLGMRSPYDPPVLVATASKAKQLLGWKARHSKLDVIIETAYRWHTR